MHNLSSAGFAGKDVANNDIANNDLADSEWHQIEIRKRNSTTLTLYVDIDKSLINVPGFYSKRFTHQTFYLGGVDASITQSRHPVLRQRSFVPFEGCLQNDHVKINGLMLLNLAKRGNATIHGRQDDSRCNITYAPITFLKPESFIKIMASPNTNKAKYSFKFRTYNGEGILLFQRITKDNGATIFISLVSGRIKLEVDFASKSTPVTLHGGSALDDGMWHSVAVDISIQNVRLIVDSEQSSQSQRSQGTFVSSSEVFVGASDKDRPGFVGCMRDLTVQGRTITNFTKIYKSHSVIIDGCSLNDLCVPNPCQNGGRCSQRWNRTICHCSGTDFKGPKCETPSFFMQTCADWRAAGKRSNKYYKINPRHSEPFSVYCNMTNVNGPSTVIFHTQDRNRIIAAQNKVNGKSYRHEIVYENPNDQDIKDLIASSTHCRQYLEYNCYNSVLFDSPKPFNLESGRGARWVSRDGNLQDYWSGATRGSMKCACGLNGTCAESSSNKVCNCDTVDNKWHTDGGYITDSTSLPVKRLQFSVDGTNIRSKYVLGSLECYGSTTKRATTTTKAPVNDTLLTTPQPASTKRQTKSPSTATTTMTSGKQPVTEIDGTSTPIPPSSLSSENDVSSTKSSSSSESTTQATDTPSDNTDTPGIVVIESPKEYITIRENANQELVLIILSVILAVFVIAIVVLIIKQNLFFPCKCLQAPLYHDARHMDTIELGPPSPMYGETEPEPILQFEASPYPARHYDIGSVHDFRISPSPELYSDAETDRLDISNGSSSWISENADIEKDKSEKQTVYEDIDLGLIDVVPSFPAPKQLSTEEQIKKLKAVIMDVLSASDVRANYSDRKEHPASPIHQARNAKDTTHCALVIELGQSQHAANESLVDSDNDSTATMSELSSDHEFLNGDQCAKNYSCDKETDFEKEAYDESSKANTLETCKPAIGRNGVNLNNWVSSNDPHDNYLSLDVNNLEDDTYQRQPFSGANLNGHSYNEQISCDKDLRRSPRTEKVRCLPATCDGRRRELKEDKRSKHNSPRTRLFSRQKSEEEALLSSTQAGGRLEPRRTNRNGFSDNSNQKRYSGISNAFCRQPQQQQNPRSSDENQADNQFRDCSNMRARVIPLKHPHSQKYETEL